jgi:exopolysaccharide biosynthesis polyprenyl glycosylphosphotransferase
MKPRTTTNVDLLITLGSIAVTLLMLQPAMWLRQVLPVGRELELGAEIIPPMVYPIVAVIWLAMMIFWLKPRIVRNGHLLDLLGRLVAMVGLASLTFAGMLYLSFRDVSRLFFICFVLLDLVALLGFYGAVRIFVRQRSRRAGALSRVLIVGTGTTGARLARALRVRMAGATTIAGFLDEDPRRVGEAIDGIPVISTLDNTVKIIDQHQIDEIIIALPLESHPRVVALVRELQGTPAHIRVVPDFLDFAVLRASVDYLEGLPIVGLRVPALSDEARVAKRLFDIIVSALLLVLLAPIFGIISALIRRDSPGPAIYRAERVGENGRLFQMYKFRTMVEDAEQQWESVIARRPDGRLSFKHPDDPRITRIGRWLRRTSLDELPQLINVLKGEMSLVGPRPELPVIVREEYEPWQWSRFTVPQGMTGWWQINRRGYEHQHLCTTDDLYYIQNYSLLLDISILLQTVRVVLGGKGAY